MKFKFDNNAPNTHTYTQIQLFAILRGLVKKKYTIQKTLTEFFLSFSWKEWIIDPSEEFYYTWLQIMILPICYNWVIIIFR